MIRFSPARAAAAAIGAVVAAASVAGAVALLALPPLHITRDAVSVSAQPPAGASIATCTGPLLAAGRDVSQAAQLTDAAAPSVTAGARGGAPVGESVLAATSVSDGAGPVVLRAEPGPDGVRTDLAGAGSASAAAPDLVGFAASACTRTEPESWLVGASGATGASDLVVLANPGEVPALVTLTVYGAAGLTEPAAGKDVVVAAGTQRVVPVAALALGEENPVVHVSASQAPVRASLQTSITRVLAPGGVDQVADAGAPATSLVIPGLPVVVPPGDAGSSEVVASLRLLAPASDGTATVTVDGEAGIVTTQTVPLTAGVPLRLDLGGLPVGTYTVRIAATAAVTGAAWAATGVGSGSDFGWFVPAEPVEGDTLVAVAVGPAPVLTIAAGDGGDQNVTLTPLGGGAGQQVTVASGATVTVPVSDGTVYDITADGAGIFAGVTFAGGDAVAGYTVSPGDAASAAIRVYPR